MPIAQSAAVLPVGHVLGCCSEELLSEQQQSAVTGSLVVDNCSQKAKGFYVYILFYFARCISRGAKDNPCVVQLTLPGNMMLMLMSVTSVACLLCTVLLILAMSG